VPLSFGDSAKTSRIWWKTSNRKKREIFQRTISDQEDHRATGIEPGPFVLVYFDQPTTSSKS